MKTKTGNGRVEVTFRLDETRFGQQISSFRYGLLEYQNLYLVVALRSLNR